MWIQNTCLVLPLQSMNSSLSESQCSKIPTTLGYGISSPLIMKRCGSALFLLVFLPYFLLLVSFHCILKGKYSRTGRWQVHRGSSSSTQEGGEIPQEGITSNITCNNYDNLSLSIPSFYSTSHFTRAGGWWSASHWDWLSMLQAGKDIPASTWMRTPSRDVWAAERQETTRR